MSFNSRERKRRTRIAVARAKREHRGVMATRYYLTIVKRPARCCACGKHLRVGGEMVYRRNGNVTLSLPHADADPLVEYRTLVKWEQRRKRERGRAAA
jgi:predicted PP-loop superfamily ATPase